jgi:RNA polymerase sigma factor (sigma-70 family)
MPHTRIEHVHIPPTAIDSVLRHLHETAYTELSADTQSLRQEIHALRDLRNQQGITGKAYLVMRNELVVRHTPLVIAILSKIKSKDDRVDDMFQEGVIGLTRALDAYSPSKEGAADFGTYAYLAIRNAIYRSYRNSHAITYPPHTPVEKRHTLESLSRPVSHSMETEEIELADTLPTEDTTTIPDEEIGRRDSRLHRILLANELLGLLTQRQSEALIHRFSGEDTALAPYTVIAGRMGTSYQRVEQLVKKALTDIKKSTTSHMYRRYQEC